MAKLSYKFGTVNSAKTLNLLSLAHNYKQNNKKIILIKPEIDDRFGKETIKTRSGMVAKADLLIKPNQKEINFNFDGIDCVLVDEVQFIPPEIIEIFYEITYKQNVPVICYGLRTDFRKNIFPAVTKLIELADNIEEIKSICAYCNQKAKFNLKLINGKPTIEGPTIDLGCEEKYVQTCSNCFEKQFDNNTQSIKVVFTSGVFDLLHAGHLELLNKSKSLGDKLVVGINSDESTSRLKGINRPINNQQKRKRTLELLKFIDEVIIFNEDTPYELIKRIKPKIIVKGSDYTKETVVGNDLAEVFIVSNLEGFSTTSIISKILS